MTMIQEDIEATPASGSSPKLDAAERDVARAHAKFNADLERVSYAGRRLTKTIVNGARPALIGVAVVTGVALIVAALRWRRTQPARLFSAPEQRSVWRELSRAAVTALASSAGRHIAAKFIEASQRHAAAAAGQFEGGVNPRPPADS
jgi:hypothetical protein